MKRTLKYVPGGIIVAAQDQALVTNWRVNVRKEQASCAASALEERK